MWFFGVDRATISKVSPLPPPYHVAITLSQQNRLSRVRSGTTHMRSPASHTWRDHTQEEPGLAHPDGTFCGTGPPMPLYLVQPSDAALASLKVGPSGAALASLKVGLNVTYLSQKHRVCGASAYKARDLLFSCTMWD
ncbi:hypothetical protein MUK42_37025 [Musa troglodytarum]|uniref:Uncharacterized protein n=1 Tax=Musa troglodytarum TaxID=320322 RepID=A0A9E7JDD6_9LILI|nr:hypothetical protein MUK42_37025 [Musa troglodytarum]